MSEPSPPAPPPMPGTSIPGSGIPGSGIPGSGIPGSGNPGSRYVDFFLYASAALTYIPLSIYNKWLLDWIVGPFWLVAWVWGLPALVRLVRRQPIRPQRDPRDEIP